MSSSALEFLVSSFEPIYLENGYVLISKKTASVLYPEISIPDTMREHTVGDSMYVGCQIKLHDDKVSVKRGQDIAEASTKRAKVQHLESTPIPETPGKAHLRFAQDVCVYPKEDDKVGNYISSALVPDHSGGAKVDFYHRLDGSFGGGFHIAIWHIAQRRCLRVSMPLCGEHEFRVGRTLSNEEWQRYYPKY